MGSCVISWCWAIIQLRAWDKLIWMGLVWDIATSDIIYVTHAGDDVSQSYACREKKKYNVEPMNITLMK